MKDKFIEATDKWYRFVGKDHHKEHDCHWYVGQETDYAYGEDSDNKYWFVRHNGYIIDDFWECGKTEDEVMQKAIDFIEKEISNQSNPIER